MTLAVYRASLRLTLRSAWVWVVTVALLPWVYVLSRLVVGWTGLTDFFHQPFVWVPFFLAQTLATVAAAQQERASRTEELLEALPYRSGAVALGRMGGIYTVWLAAGTLVYLLPVAQVVLRQHPPFSALMLWDWIWLLPLTLLFTTGVAYGIGTIMKRGFGAYFVTLLLFLAASFPFNQPLSQFFRDGLGGGPLSLLDFTLSSYFPVTRLPLFPDRLPMTLNRLHVIGVGLFWLAAVTWLWKRRRREPGIRLPAGLSLSLLAAVLMVFTVSRAVWAERVAQMAIESTAVKTTVLEPVAGIPAPVVSGYQVSVKFTTEHHWLDSEAVLQVQAAPDQALFTLNHDFQVAAVVGPDGKPVPFARSGDQLLLTTGGRSGEYRVTYSGMVGQWRPDNWGGLRLAAHVAAESIVLPASLGWYPVPGQQTLAYLGPSGWGGPVDGAVWHRPAEFRLTVEGMGGLQLVTNAGGTQPLTAAWIIGTPNQPDNWHWLNPVNRLGWEWDRLQAELVWYEEWVPLGEPLRIVDLPAALWYGIGNQTVDGFPGAMVMPDTALGRLDNMLLHGYMLSVWWSTPRSEEEHRVQDVLRLFMAESYQRETQHDPTARAYISQFAIGRQLGTDTEVGRQLLSRLHQFREQSGLQATGAVLQSLRRSEAPLTMQQVADALRRGQP